MIGVAGLTMTTNRPFLPISKSLSRDSSRDGVARHLVHWVDTWSKRTSHVFVVCVWFGGIGSLIWFLASITQESAVEIVFFAALSLVLFGGMDIFTLVYEMLIVPYVRKTDRELNGSAPVSSSSARRANLRWSLRSGV